MRGPSNNLRGSVPITARAIELGAVALVLAVSGPAGVSAAPAEPAAAVILDSLVVRVYDNTGTLSGERARGFAGADAILSRADIDVEWIDCPARKWGRAASICATPPARSELMIRLLNARGSEIEHTNQALGYSLIDTVTGTGTMATVFVDRVWTLADAARTDRATVLGRAIAHEIGHLILGSNEHSAQGIMREKWTSVQLTSSKPQDWQFLPSQSEQMRQARQLNLSGGANVLRANPKSQTPHPKSRDRDMGPPRTESRVLN